ncbi:MAG: hypothetical protein FH748_01470 [Balneolaceae bacterium]|nr:hypothetical protein [Balneolaceae bacterium]
MSQVELNPIQLSQEEALEQLTNKVLELVGNPVSTWAVAATIESLGIRDVDAKEDYGYESVFDLAEYVYKEVKNLSQSKLDIEEGIRKFKIGSFSRSAKMFLKHYSAGLIFSMPMISQIIAILIFEYALWAWFNFNEAQATVVAFGTIVAFVVTGGFIQTLGRLVSRYKGEGNMFLASKATAEVMRIAIPAVLLVGAAVFMLNILLPFYPQSMVALAIIYMVLISFLLLSSAVLFATQQRTVILIGILLGTAVVIICMDFLGMGIYLSQWLGILFGTVVMTVYGVVYFRLKIKSLRQEISHHTLPDKEVTYYNSYRYFIYGFCYFLFLFMDRIIAWSAGPPPPAYIIWFNTPYELGMDWALISLVVTIAMLEFSIHSFSKNLIPAQKKAMITKIKLFNRHFRQFYVRQILLLLVVGGISIILTYYGVLSLKIFEDKVPEIRDFFANPMTFQVFWMASIGYLLLTYGLLNSLFFFTLNRPEFVMYSMIGSLLVNFVVGYFCSRTFGLEYATIGLIVGALTFSLSTGIMARKFFKNLDYYYYSAF